MTDYQEVYLTGTDPTKYDSIIEGLCDADVDSDEDGLANIYEIENGTDPLSKDTDNDGLTDYEEIFIYNTNPVIPDTDGDGLEDGDEPHISLDPTNPETFGFPDIEYSIQQQITVDSELFSEINIEENPYELSIDLKTNGYAEKNLYVSQSRYSVVIDNEAMLGFSTDIEMDDIYNPESVVLKYKIKDNYLNNTLGIYSDYEEFQGIKRFNVFKFNEDKNMLLPVNTEFDVENGLLYAEVDELGTYCIMDMEIWFNMLGVVPEIELEEQSYTLFDSEIQDNTFSIDNQRFFKKYFFKNKTYALYEKTGLSWEEAKRYCESLGGHLVTITSPEEQNFINNILSDSYNNLYWIGTKKVNNRWSWVTGEPFAYVNWAENEPSPQTNENYVHIYAKSNSNSINKGEWNNTVFFYNEVHSFYNTSNCGFICEWENNPNISQEYCIIVPTNWKKISLNGELNSNNNIDTDGDTITDWEEVDTSRLIWNDDGSFEIPTLSVVDIVSTISRYQDAKYNYLFEKAPKQRFLPIISDPTMQDSDKDGILDPDEYTNLTTDSRYDNINPLKADNLETLYPELTQNSKTNVDTNPIYLDIRKNTIYIDVKYKLNDKAYELSDIIKPGSTDCYTNEDIIIKSISDKWNTEIQGNIFDFYPGMSIKIEVNLIEALPKEKYIEFIVGDNGGGFASFEEQNWYTNNLKYINIFINNDHGEPYSEVRRLTTPAHEFGHTLGVTDLYGYTKLKNYDWRLQPVIYDISKTTENEIWYNLDGNNVDGDLMYNFGMVRPNDIEMVLQAYCYNQEQYFRPEFDKENEVSKAIKENHDNIYLDRYNKEFVIFDPVNRVTSSIGDKYDYQKYLEDNYNTSINIDMLEKIYGKNNIT